ncbi:hypothetical protein J7K52_03095 [Candidatus Bathyarchaeota archaeon]|nr:hypothetical protein [Candidatus Bathyarchaeota archaeon]HDM44962.1 hypothetical protein [Candidatus Bathyarchaeota archaeon]
MIKTESSHKNSRKRNGELEERCENPWNKRCGNSDIILYIYYKGRRLPICRSCWAEISQKDIEWS